MRRIFQSNGYTLIELLTVLSILVIVSSLIAGILYSTLRGSSKSKITNAVAQNGNYALSVMSGLIMSSQKVTAVGGSQISSCAPKIQGTSITIRGNDGGTTVLLCDATNKTISSNGASLIDKSTVQIETQDPSLPCYFLCQQPSGDPFVAPIVEVGFTLTDKKASSLFENKGSATFKTSVSLRNYNPE